MNERLFNMLVALHCENMNIMAAVLKTQDVPDEYIKDTLKNQDKAFREACFGEGSDDDDPTGIFEHRAANLPGAARSDKQN